jgi:hypothetical protein
MRLSSNRELLYLSSRARRAWQSDEVVARAKPVAISGVPSLCSGEGFIPRIKCGVLAMTLYNQGRYVQSSHPND